MTRRGITFGALPETERRLEPQPTTPLRRAAERLRQGPRAGTRTVMGGGLTCDGHGEVVSFSTTRSRTEVTAFGRAAQEFIGGFVTARLLLRGGQVPNPGGTLTVRRGTQYAFTGLVRSVFASTPLDMWNYDVDLDGISETGEEA